MVAFLPHSLVLCVVCFDAEVVEIGIRCLDLDPSKRPTAAELSYLFTHYNINPYWYYIIYNKS